MEQRFQMKSLYGHQENKTMKKLLFLFVVSASIFGCNPKEKKPDTVLITPISDTTRVIDTTIIEPGIAPVVVIGDETFKKKEDKQKKEKISCGFGFKKLNTKKRPIEEAPGGKKGKPVKPGTEPPPPPPPPGTSTNVIYVNFFGKDVINTMWNVNGPFSVQDAGLAQSEIDYTLAQVRLHYDPYNVVVTQDKAIFDAATIGHRVEIVVTEDWQWYGQAGGVAYINSFFWTDGSPAFVFSTLLSYNSHNIAEAIAHEAGHTLGLRHQSDCVNGVKTNEYSNGKTMGVSYYVPLGAWVIGTNSFCAEQNDNAILTTSVGVK